MSLKDGRHLFALSTLIVLLIFTIACWKNDATEEPTYPEIDARGARVLSDTVAANLKANRREELKQELEKKFREAFTGHEVDAMIEHLIESYGQLVDFEFKQQEVGQKSYPDGSTKPMRKFWYAATTTKFEKGSHFLVIEVVPDGNDLAVSSFAIVSFPLEVPENLR